MNRDTSPTPSAAVSFRTSEPPPRELALPLWASRWWALTLVLAIAEVVALGVRAHRIAPPEDWAVAGEFVRRNFQLGDAISAAPAWTAPTLRLHLGDKITPRIAGRSGLAGFERLWVLSIRGARAEDAPGRVPDVQRSFGRVTVSRYDFAPSPEVLDLADALPQAKVSVRRNGSDTPCRFNAQANGPVTAGLSRGPAPARQRFECDRRRRWNYVGVTMLETVDLAPRRCIWQHPVGAEPVSVTYEDVHLGTHVIFHAGLSYYDERAEKGANVHVRVSVDGREAAHFVHQDGDGFKSFRLDTLPEGTEALPRRGSLRIDVTSAEPRGRSFCWSGSIRDAERREGT